LIEANSEQRSGVAYMTSLRAISLFSNCGAGDVGYKDAGFHFDVMAELDPRRLEVSLLNHPGAMGVSGDLRETWPTVIATYRQIAGCESPALLAACPPCQGMSSARSDRGQGEDADAGSKDKRNLLVIVIAHVAHELRPSIVVVENVPAFLTRKIRHPSNHKPISAANLLIRLLEADYDVFPILVDLCDYGVPQTRKRSFLTFVRRDLRGLQEILAGNRAPYPRPSHAHDYGGAAPIKLCEALKMSNLPSLDAKSIETAQSLIGKGLHSVPVWPHHRYSMVAAIPPNSGESAWKNNICEQCGPVNAKENDAVCPICNNPLLRPIVKMKDGTYRLVRGFRSSSYRRMSPNRPASTITTASGHVGSDCTIHPFENRVLSALECAYLQTFPIDFNWGEALKKWGHTNVREMIGEAVPPLFTRLHGMALLGVLTGRWSVAPISTSDRRCISARKNLKLLP
jgi:DNA (cytosine-5)-methyltransferase 1